MIIRGETPADFAAVHELVTAAFQRPDEALLVDRLHSNDECVISLVAVDGVEIVGHILFSRMTAPFRALGLGPVSVKSHRQRGGDRKSVSPHRPGTSKRRGMAGSVCCWRPEILYSFRV